MIFLIVFSLLLLLFNFKNIFSLLFALMGLTMVLFTLALTVEIFRVGIYQVAWNYFFSVVDARIFLIINRNFSLSRSSILIIQNASVAIYQFCILIFMYFFGKYRKYSSQSDKGRRKLFYYGAAILAIIVHYYFFHPEVGFRIFLAQHLMEPGLGNVVLGVSYYLLLFLTVFKYMFLFLPIIYLIYHYKKKRLTLFIEQLVGLVLVLFFLNMLFILITVDLPIIKWNELLRIGFWRGLSTIMIPTYNYSYLPLASLFLILAAGYLLIRYQTFNLADFYKTVAVSKKLRRLQNNLRDVLHSEKNVIFNFKILAESALNNFGNEDGREKLERLVTLSDSHMKTLASNINNIRDFRVTSLNRDFKDAIDDALKAYPIPSNISIVQNFYQEGAVCRYDHYHVTKLLINILENAVDAVKDKNDAQLILTLDISDYWVYFSLEDNGRGMPRKVLKKAMRPYFSTKSKQSNWGIGLSYVEKVMKAHFGYISIRSKEHEGTKVELLFMHKKNGRGMRWKKLRSW